MALALEESGTSVDQMAARLRVHRNTVLNYLGGRRQPPHSTIEIWAMQTGYPVEWLDTGSATDAASDGEPLDIWSLAVAA